MKWYHDLRAIVREDVSLAERTWYRLGGSARYYCTPHTIDQVCRIVQQTQACGIALRVLGGGANVLVRDQGFDGAVLQLPREHFGRVSILEDGVRAGAAVDLPDLVRQTVKRGQSGLECLAGIPGTVGGAVRMNAGGRFGEIGSRVVNVTFIDRNAMVQCWDKDRLHFEYRRTNLSDAIVTEVTFALDPVDADELQSRYKEIWDYKKNSQPFTRNNAGCIFRNPLGHHAGQLIDRAGLKGASCGGASVCEQHANFIVTEPGTKAEDVLTLISRIRRDVRQQYQVDLELEVDVW